MIASVRIVAMTLDLLRWNDDPLPVLSPASEERGADVLDLGRAAVLLVAAALGRIVGHVPRRVELLVDGRILRRMVVTVILSLRREGKGKTDNQATCTKTVHDEPPSKDRMPVINSNAVRNTGSDGMGIDNALKRARTAGAIAHCKLLILLRADRQIQTVEKVPANLHSSFLARSCRVECSYSSPRLAISMAAARIRAWVMQ